MPDILKPQPQQYLRDEVIRGGMDLLLFAHKSHLRHSDAELDRLGLGRAHHRVLYFVARQPDMTVSELLAVLGVTKQSLGRVLRSLIEQGYVAQRPGEADRRQRLLRLTDAGVGLEHRLFTELRDNMARAYSAAGEQAVVGYWTMMQHLMSDEARGQFVAFHRAQPPSIAARPI